MRNIKQPTSSFKKISISIAIFGVIILIWEAGRVYERETKLNDFLAQNIAAMDKRTDWRLNKIETEINALNIDVKVLESLKKVDKNG